MTNHDMPDISKLNDSNVHLILSHLTVNLRAGMTAEELGAVHSEKEAREALSSFLEVAGEQASDQASSIFAEDDVSYDQARKLLEYFLLDETTRSPTEALVSDPPDDSQRSLEAVALSAVILGALIGWLQTKVEIDVSRQGGETNFRFHLKKEASEKDVISQAATTISSLLRGGL